jgi:hypothetical protein
MANGESYVPLWHLAWTGVLSLISVLGVIVMGLFRWNWTKLNEDVRKAHASIEALYEEKADKDEVDKKHIENVAHFTELKEAIEQANAVREEMWRALSAIDKNVGILLDRDKRDKDTRRRDDT